MKQPSGLDQDLQFAIRFRENIGAFTDTEAVRIFYGPGESSHSELKEIAIDQFSGHFWITQWKKVSKDVLGRVVEFLQSEFKERLQAVVLMDRSSVASESEVTPLYGSPKAGRMPVVEWGVSYLVQMSDTKHPGLFLDHAPLRKWLLTTQNKKSVLNLFSYTGSLSVAAAKGGASQVTTIDLSKSTLEWAKENWNHAGLQESQGDFIYGDVFEWLPKLAKRGARFDTILCDPPSFSRSNRGTFSTQKDSGRLHEAILPLLKTGGMLVTSINSENYSERNFLKDIQDAAGRLNCGLRVIGRVDLPPTFPTGDELSTRYLKGFYLLKV